MFSIDVHMKLKKSALLGLVVLLAGIGLLGWLLWQKQARVAQILPWYEGLFRTSAPTKTGQWPQMPHTDQEKFDQILEELQALSEQDRVKEQEKRLQADLEMLASYPPDDPLLAQVLYGKGWETEVSSVRAQKGLRELLLATSLALTGIGGAVCLMCFLLRLTRLIIRRSCSVFRHDTEVNDSCVSDSDAPVRTVPSCIQAADIEPPGCRPKLAARPDQAQDTAGIPNKLPGTGTLRDRDDHDCPTYKRDQPVFNEYCLNDLSASDIRLRNLFSDQPLSQPVAGGSGWQDQASELPSVPENAAQPDASEPSSDPGTTLTASLQSEAETPEEQIHALPEMVQDVQAPVEAQPEPMNRALLEMSSQISAIRDYAASQQDRVEKLQNGYDWNIIRQFGLRIIRCIDNLEQRIDAQAQESPGGQQLTEIRDELLFALESSGIEQFMPELHSPYRGQERTAEAVKEKEPCADSASVGKIANIIKPGYQYVIDEENVKVVRTARVKLYG